MAVVLVAGVLCVDTEVPYVLRVKVELSNAYGAITVLLYKNLSDVWSFRLFIDFIFTVNEHYDVGILLDGAGVTKVREARLSTSLLDGTREL